MHPAKYWKQEGSLIRCGLCPRKCSISKDKTGFCGVRRNIDNKLYSLVYGRPAALNVDPIEKKPFYNFNPGSKVLSLGTLGCNFRCKFCINWDISQAKINESFEERLPEEIVHLALKTGSQGIAYTYVEPTIFFEYALDCAKLAKKKGLFNVFVTNGYSMQKPLRDIKPYLDGVVIDFKGNNEDFYKEASLASLKEVKKGALQYKNNTNAFIEITNLVVPGKNDSPDEILEQVKWIRKHFGRQTPYHLIRFYPSHKMADTPQTPVETMVKLYKLAKEELDYVYLGNVDGTNYDNTCCPKCGELLIKREMFSSENINLKDGKCGKCKSKINISGQVYC
jgi:pyruvate formate lyase activating enzyme